ncbi:MAG TPA: deoxyribodipyrimidine photo-lyase [Williamwhitmania sp.]|nr:deoxyribodipyrimidine photo-lyase [Williamwhitmania sp.]
MSVIGPRVKVERDGDNKEGPVIYWMSRDQRFNDNWALLYCQKVAAEMNTHVEVVFCLAPSFLDASLRSYDFMIAGLKELERGLEGFHIPFHLLLGQPEEQISNFIECHKAALLVTDFDPLRIKQQWLGDVVAKVTIPVITVDAHNIVPCWLASSKQEFGAYTLRPKLNRLLPNFLTEFPQLQVQEYSCPRIKNSWDAIHLNSTINPPALVWIKPGEKAAKQMLDSFITKRLNGYAEKRNLPELSWLSHLSPYLHFGMLSAQRVALEIQKSEALAIDKESFLEELIVRRELADNFCYYNKNYDSFLGLPSWAQASLNQHRQDERDYTYPLEVFGKAKTHDPLWNAAQKEMGCKGKMHGYMRMYWAKKILEWTSSPEEALEIAIYLNDTYSLDGRDPNGYAGIAWAIGGVHDRAWFERPVFGKIRYMNFNGAKRKFDVEAYIKLNS